MPLLVNIPCRLPIAEVSLPAVLLVTLPEIVPVDDTVKLPLLVTPPSIKPFAVNVPLFATSPVIAPLAVSVPAVLLVTLPSIELLA